MLTSFLLALREGLEAALIVSIVLGVLNRLKQHALKPWVWWGVGVAILICLIVGLGLYEFGASLEGAAEEVFEGLASLFAAAVLTWMILWMQRQGRYIKQNLEHGTAQALQSGGKALFFLAFIAVFREGLELALFLLASSMITGDSATLIGALIGLGAALSLAWLLFTSTLHLNLRAFFQVTSLLLIFFAAGLVAYGIHELNEVGWVPPLIEHLWDINSILDEKSQLGLVLKAIFGYNGNPSLSEVLGYVLFLSALLVNYLRFQRQELRSISRLSA